MSPTFSTRPGSCEPGSHDPGSQLDSLLPVLSHKYPPCRVCNGRGAGVHYGVNACQACKSFFGRCLYKLPMHPCRKSGVCPIVAGGRMCGACRYQKCLAVGMSKEGIKIGRSCYIQVTAAIEEVKRLELELKLRRDGTVMSGEERLAAMSDVIHKLTDIHLTLIPHTNTFLQDIRASENNYLEAKSIEEQLYGQRSLLLRGDYNEVYRNTNIDVDGRRAFLKKVCPVMEQGFNLYLCFQQFIPGYTKLSVNDQRRLMKSGMFEAGMLLFNNIYNADFGIFAYPTDTSMIIEVDHLLGFSDEWVDVYDRLSVQMSKVQKLELTVEEKVVAAALSLLLSDADLSPSGRSITSANADTVTEYLIRLIERNHEPEELVYPKLMAIITELRLISPYHTQHTRNMVADNRDLPLPSGVVRMYAE